MENNLPYAWKWFESSSLAERVAKTATHMTGDPHFVEAHGLWHFKILRITPEGKVVDA